MADLPTQDTTAETQRPWDRLPQESDSAWQAFIEYRDMGLDRTAQRVADILGKSVAHIFTYSSKFSWRQRVVAFEQWMDSHRLQEFETANRDMARRHAYAAGVILKKATTVIMNTPDEFIGIREAIAMFRAAMPMERLSRAVDHPPPKPVNYASIGDDLSVQDSHHDDEPTPEQMQAIEEEEAGHEPPPGDDD